MYVCLCVVCVCFSGIDHYFVYASIAILSCAFPTRDVSGPRPHNSFRIMSLILGLTRAIYFSTVADVGPADPVNPHGTSNDHCSADRHQRIHGCEIAKIPQVAQVAIFWHPSLEHDCAYC
jgi:hypothetical protein